MSGFIRFRPPVVRSVKVNAYEDIAALVPGIEWGMQMDQALELILRELMRLRAEKGLDETPRRGTS